MSQLYVIIILNAYMFVLFTWNPMSLVQPLIPFYHYCLPVVLFHVYMSRGGSESVLSAIELTSS